MKIRFLLDRESQELVKRLMEKAKGIERARNVTKIKLANCIVEIHHVSKRLIVKMRKRDEAIVNLIKSFGLKEIEEEHPKFGVKLRG